MVCMRLSFGRKIFAILSENDEHIHTDKINSDDLSKTNLLLLGEGHCLTDQVLSVCALSKSEIQSSFLMPA